jgi:hypothetical protein
VGAGGSEGDGAGPGLGCAGGRHALRFARLAFFTALRALARAFREALPRLASRWALPSRAFAARSFSAAFVQALGVADDVAPGVALAGPAKTRRRAAARAILAMAPPYGAVSPLPSGSPPHLTPKDLGELSSR